MDKCFMLKISLLTCVGSAALAALRGEEGKGFFPGVLGTKCFLSATLRGKACFQCLVSTISCISVGFGESQFPEVFCSLLPSTISIQKR